ncbi:MAG: HlyD family secretion protein, partial [Shewanella sp.]
MSNALKCHQSPATRIAISMISTLLLIGTVACSQQSSDGVLTLKIAPADFKVDIPAAGELEASNSTTVT